MKKNDTFDWEVVLGVDDPKAKNSQTGQGTRPRRMSIHAIATFVGRDPLKVLEEMRLSGKAVGYLCPDVGGAPIFYLVSNAGRMIDTRDAGVWEQAAEILKGGKHPYGEKYYGKYKFPQVRGFFRFPTDGKSFGMDTPLMPEEGAYGKAIEEALRKFQEKA